MLNRVAISHKFERIELEVKKEKRKKYIQRQGVQRIIHTMHKDLKNKIKQGFLIFELTSTRNFKLN